MTWHQIHTVYVVNLCGFKVSCFGVQNCKYNNMLKNSPKNNLEILQIELHKAEVFLYSLLRKKL